MAHHHSHTLQHTRHRDLDAQLVKGSHKPQQHRSETTDGGTWLRTANNDNLKQAERSTWMPGAAHGAKKPLTAITQHQPPSISHPGLWQTTEANFTSSSSACQGQRSPNPSLTWVPLPEHLQAVPLVQGAAAVHRAAHGLVQLQLPLEARVHPALRETEREGQGLRPGKGRQRLFTPSFSPGTHSASGLAALTAAYASSQPSPCVFIK